jgi:hypothetical protein
VKSIPLSQGFVAIVDDVDFDALAGFTWLAHRSRRTVYAHRWQYDANGARQRIIMHRVLLGAPSGVQVDHRNGDGLDNRRENLRLARNGENAINWQRTYPKSSRFRGVSWCRKSGVWIASIRARRTGNPNTVHLGTFTDEVEAAKAYDLAALQHHGDFAVLNFAKETQTS